MGLTGAGKMTIESLKEIELLRKELTDLRRRARRRKARPYDIVNGSLSRFPYTPVRIAVEGAVERYINDTQRLQSECAERIAGKILEIEQWLVSVDSSYIRQIVRIKYIDGLPWRKVPVNMGLDGDGTTEYYALKRYMRNVSTNSTK